MRLSCEHLRSDPLEQVAASAHLTDRWIDRIHFEQTFACSESTSEEPIAAYKLTRKGRRDGNTRPTSTGRDDDMMPVHLKIDITGSVNFTGALHTAISIYA